MSEQRRGYKTSEFWATAVAAIVPVLNSALGWNLPVEALASIAVSVAAYVISRGQAKKGAAAEG